MGLLKEQTPSQKPLAGRAAPAALGSYLPSPAILESYCPGKQHDYFFFVLLPIILYSYFVPNEHCVLPAISQYL